MATRQSQRSRWKNVERRIAELMHGARIPLLGREGQDLDVPYFFVEVKSRKEIGQYLWTDYFEQILTGMHVAGETTKVPAIVLHRPGMAYKDALVCFRVGDLEKLITLIQEAGNDLSKH
jgi:hypothetical protein